MWKKSKEIQAYDPHIQQENCRLVLWLALFFFNLVVHRDVTVTNHYCRYKNKYFIRKIRKYYNHYNYQ